MRVMSGARAGCLRAGEKRSTGHGGRDACLPLVAVQAHGEA